MLCITDCTTHGTATLIFGDKCVTSCPLGSTPVGGKCICNGTTLAHENGACAASCTPYFWHHYGVCLDALRTDDVFFGPPINTATEVFCPTSHFINYATKKCQISCVLPNLALNLVPYGNTCITPTDCVAIGKVIDEKYT